MSNLSRFISDRFLGLMGGDENERQAIIGAIETGANALSNIEAGSNISLSLVDGVLTISASGGGGGVSSFNSLTGAVVLAAGSNITLTPVGNTITVASAASANPTLSNLTSPTAINQDILPASDGSANLGVFGQAWGSIECGILRAENHIITNEIDADAAGADLFLGTLNNPVGNSGQIAFGTGSASGVRGSILLDGSFIDANSTQIKSVSDPTLAQDAATKNYVDTHVGLPTPLEAVAIYASNSWGSNGSFVGNVSNSDQINQVVLLGSTDTAIAANVTSSAVLISGDNTAASSTGSTGGVFIRSGSVSTGSGNTGPININVGSADSGSGGGINIAAGNSSTGSGGDLAIHAGSANGGTSIGGNMSITAGDSSGNDAGNISISSGTSGDGDSGDISVTTGDSTGGTRGDITLSARFIIIPKDPTNFFANITTPDTNASTSDTDELDISTGLAAGATSNSGPLYVYSGFAQTGDSGILDMRSGNTHTGNTGDVTVASGIAATSGGGGSGNSGTLNLLTGDTANGDSGDILIAVGGATGTRGTVHVAPELRLNGLSSGYVGLKAPNAPTSYTATLPAAQGAANTVLRNDGTGVLSWFAGASGTFTTTDLKTVTVVNGLITSIV